MYKKEIFFDTNIIIDLLTDREPFSKLAVKLFDDCLKKKIKIHVSSLSIANVHYILKKYIDERELRKILKNLIELVNIIDLDVQIIKKSLNSKMKDFEDAVQENSAKSIKKIEWIITRNVKDFKYSELKVMTAEECIMLINEI